MGFEDLNTAPTLGDAVAAVSAVTADERLFDEFAEAVRQQDRAGFDRLFDRCFGQVYAMAWRLTGDRLRSEAITTDILRDVVIEAL
jgi:hypothetical protein